MMARLWGVNLVRKSWAVLKVVLRGGSEVDACDGE
jgi:hypothetical protein